MDDGQPIRVKIGAGARRYEIQPDTPELQAIIDAVSHWIRLTDLVGFAIQRQGYGDTDGGFGVTYPGDLDEFDWASGVEIPDGSVQVYTFFGPPAGCEFRIPEAMYLQVLAKVMAANQLFDEARKVEDCLSDIR